MMGISPENLASQILESCKRQSFHPDVVLQAFLLLGKLATEYLEKMDEEETNAD